MLKNEINSLESIQLLIQVKLTGPLANVEQARIRIRV